MEKNIQLIIPMSGIGKRFIDAGYEQPKPLIEVDGSPIIKHVVDMFPGVENVTFIVNESHISTTKVIETLKLIKPNCKIYTVPNENRKGPVDAVKQIFEHIDDDAETIVSYCDYGTAWNFDKFLETARTQNWDGGIPCYTGFHPHMLGSDNYAFCKEENNILIKIKEKEPFTNNKMEEFASNGTYYFKTGYLVKKYFKELIDLDLNLKGEFYVSLVYNLLVRDGLKIGIFEIEKMLQWGTPYDLEIYKGWSNYFNNIQKTLTSADHKDTTLLLPMAGKGSRFSDQGYEQPKPLINVNGKPMIIQAVDCLPTTSNKIFICAEEQINKYNVDQILINHFPNTSVVSVKKTTQGQACTCELGLIQSNFDLNKPILISACDNGVLYNAENYQKLIDDDSIDVIVWTFRNNQTSKVKPNMYSWVDVDTHNKVQFVSCKKFVHEDPLKTHAIIGTFFYKKAKDFLDGLKANYKENIRTGGEFYVDDVVNQNVKGGLNVVVFEVDNYICWGTPDDYKTYNYWREYFLK